MIYKKMYWNLKTLNYPQGMTHIMLKWFVKETEWLIQQILYLCQVKIIKEWKVCINWKKKKEMSEKKHVYLDNMKCNVHIYFIILIHLFKRLLQQYVHYVWMSMCAT